MELIIYYCTVKNNALVENVSVADGELISFEDYFGRDVDLKINALTEEEKTNIKLLKTELKKYKLNKSNEKHIDNYIKNIISLYFYTCRFNINTYINNTMKGRIDYFLWFFNKELPQNKNQDFVDLMNNINNKIGNLKDKKFFNSGNDFEFFIFLIVTSIKKTLI
jgi:hypothetical protein